MAPSAPLFLTGGFVDLMLSISITISRVWGPFVGAHLAHTIPFRNSSSGYFVPRQTIPSFHSVTSMDFSSV